MKIAILHPDLGIGGAERLIVDAALALKENGHDVTIYTSHHGDRTFEETKNGTLPVIVYGDFLPRVLFGRFYIFFAIIRAMYLALVVCIKCARYDVIMCDQNAAYCLILRLFCRSRILFYCHHPDYVQTSHDSILKRIYRLPFDLFEQYSISMADCILVNSMYTQSVYKKAFPVLTALNPLLPHVLYPCVDYKEIQKLSVECHSPPEEVEGCRYFISVNRYERKKHVENALYGFAEVMKRVRGDDLRLVIVGGYDTRLSENVEYFEELNALSRELGIEKSTLFYRNCDQTLKAWLIAHAIALLYTPENEHFGIVPLEAMALSVPVLADHSGGPRETILPEVNGYLCSRREEYGENMLKLIQQPDLSRMMGREGRARVEKVFSFQAFANQLNQEVVSIQRRWCLQLYLPIFFVIVAILGVLYFCVCFVLRFIAPFLGATRLGW